MTQRSRGAADLLAAARTGSSDALGKILESCRGYLLVIAHQSIDPSLRAKASPSDLVQETFCDAHRDFAQFHGASEEELLAWLRQVLLNRLANFARHYRGTDKRDVGREIVLPAGDQSGAPADGLAADTPSPSVRASDGEKVAALQRALDRLPEEYRRVIVLRHDENHSFEEIGQLMDRTPNAARKLWARAIERLQQELGGFDGP